VVHDAVLPTLVRADDSGGDVPLVLAGGADDAARPLREGHFLARSCPECEDSGTAVL
jgi:hypothetical protein